MPAVADGGGGRVAALADRTAPAAPRQSTHDVQAGALVDIVVNVALLAFMGLSIGAVYGSMACCGRFPKTAQQPCPAAALAAGRGQAG